MNKIKFLRKKGHRITSQRQNILQEIKDHPQTVEQIYQSLEIKPDLTSIYRTLNLLVKIRLVKELDFGDGKKRYELAEANNHHHHLICNKCGKIQDFTVEEKSLINKVKNESGFEIKKHKLEFFGLCLNCQ